MRAWPTWATTARPPSEGFLGGLMQRTLLG